MIWWRNKMELYHKITKEVLELLLKEGAQMPVDLARKLQRSSSNMQQVREYLSNIGCISVKKSRNYYDLKITEKGILLLEALKQVEMLDNPSKSVPINDVPAPVFVIKKPAPEIKIPEVIPDEVLKEAIDKEIEASEPPKVEGLKPGGEVISRGGRKGIMKRF